MMRHDHNASLWAARAPRGRKLLRRLTLGAVGATVAMIAGLSLIEQVTPMSTAGDCTRIWTGFGCEPSGKTDVAIATLPIRIVGNDRPATAVDAGSVAQSRESSPAPSVSPLPAVAPDAPRVPSSAATAAVADARPAPPEPSTDGSGKVATVAPSPPALPTLSDEELTFKDGAQHRPGAVAAQEAAKEEAARSAPPAKRKSVRPAPRTVTQTYELPDGRRVTVRRGYRDDQRLRAAEMGRRDDWFGGGYDRRGSWGGLY